MKMYKAVHGYTLKIEEKEVERVTEKFVIFPSGRREMKGGGRFCEHEWFESRSSALAWLKANCQKEIARIETKYEEAKKGLRTVNDWIAEEE
jgi:hypothetical protein